LYTEGVTDSTGVSAVVNCLPQSPSLDDDGLVATADEESWLKQVHDADNDRPTPADWLEWLHEVYVARGPLEPSRVESLARDELLRRAQEAAVLVDEDVRSTFPRPTEVTVTAYNEGVRVVVNGEMVSGAGLMSIGRAELLAEVADGAQELVMESDINWRVWPECLQHGAGLHPELDNGQAVWVCRAGRHVVASIGQLAKVGSRSPRAAKRQERARKRR